MPKPREGEDQAAFVSRCIPIVIEDGTAENAEQATAVCYSLWEGESDKGGTMTDHEYKVFPVADTVIDDLDQGIVTHTVAVMGNIDMGGDIIHPGAFTKTLVERGNKIRVIDQHKTDSILRVIGKPLELAEVRHDMLPPDVLLKFPEVQGALRVKTQFLMNTPEGRGAFERIKAGAIDEYSIGYDPIVQDFTTVTMPDGKVRNVRNLREIRLLEYSPVIWGMNPATGTIDVKEEGDGEAQQEAQPAGEDSTPNMALGAQEAAEKAGRRIRLDKAEIVYNIRALIEELAAWAEYEDGKPENEDTAPAKDAGRVEDGEAKEAGPESVATDDPPTWESARQALLDTIKTFEQED